MIFLDPSRVFLVRSADGLWREGRAVATLRAHPSPDAAGGFVACLADGGACQHCEQGATIVEAQEVSSEQDVLPFKADDKAAAAVQIPRLDLATFTRTQRRLPYMGYYHASRHLEVVPPGSFVVLGEHDLRVGLGQELAARGLFAILQTGDHAAMFTDDEEVHRRFSRAQQRCVDAGVVPLAASVREEWYLAVNDGGEAAAWPYFAGITDQYERRDRLRARLEYFYAILKTYFPGALTWACETLWNDNRSLPWPYYCPPYGADVLFIDAYLYRRPWLPGVPIAYEPRNDQNMLDKFAGEVALLVRHACTFGRPVVMVGQATTFQGPITPTQLEWFYILAQRLPQVVGLAWFTVAPEAGGYLLPECRALRAKVEELAAFNRR
jgi:hypothetical protein